MGLKLTLVLPKPKLDRQRQCTMIELLRDVEPSLERQAEIATWHG